MAGEINNRLFAVICLIFILVIICIGYANYELTLKNDTSLADQAVSSSQDTTHTISGTWDFVLNEQNLEQLGMTSGEACQIDEEYSNIVDSSLGRYSFCNYTINRLNDTLVIIELTKFANYEALNGSYQYDSSHLYSIEGLISENDFGDQSRFRVNNEHDYGGEYNKPSVYYYHLWFTKGLYLVHITSGGTDESAREYIANIGRHILSKFG